MRLGQDGIHIPRVNAGYQRLRLRSFARLSQCDRRCNRGARPASAGKQTAPGNRNNPDAPPARTVRPPPSGSHTTETVLKKSPCPVRVRLSVHVHVCPTNQTFKADCSQTGTNDGFYNVLDKSLCYTTMRNLVTWDTLRLYVVPVRERSECEMLPGLNP